MLGFSNNDFSLLAGVDSAQKRIFEKTMKLRVRMPFRLGLPIVATTGGRSRDYAKKLRSFLAGNAPQSLLNSWKTKQIDFVLAFPQAPVERDLYMEIPKGIRIEGAEDGEEACTTTS